MSGIGVPNLIAGLLQLVVPSYGLRLVRRFGAQRVGWFLVAAFASLAALHMATTTTQQSWVAPGLKLDLIVAFASGLLLIGMGHLETLLTERHQAQQESHSLERKIATAVTERTAELASANTKLEQEIARRDRQEKILKESEAQFRLMFSENPQPMLVVDLRTLRFLAVNQAAVRQYGFPTEEFLALTANDLVSAEAMNAFQAEIAGPCIGSATRGVWQHRRKDLSVFDVEMAVADLKFGSCPARLLLAVDISQRLQRDLEMKEGLKTELMGRMAGAFALQFNKFLETIDDQTSLLLRTQDSKTLEPIKQISTAVSRAGNLTRQLLTVGGRQPVSPEAIDLNRLILKSNEMVQRLLGERIVLQTDLGSCLPPILADTRSVEHVLVQLVLNARHAMSDGGTLTIQTALTRIDQHQARKRFGAKVGEFVRLDIRDTGCGMAREVQAHVFEPFFTTRDTDTATGLGLAGIRGEVNQQGGWVEFKTEVGVGTEFQVYFPCVRSSSTVVSEALHAPTSVVLGSVLLVEPDDRIRGLARYGLNRNGYHVIEADCADTVLRLWEGQSSKVDLMVMDVQLPGVSGKDLAQQLRQTRPNLRIVLTRPSASDEHHSPSVEGSENLSKPYTVDQLLQAVRTAWPKSSSEPASKPSRTTNQVVTNPGGVAGP